MTPVYGAEAAGRALAEMTIFRIVLANPDQVVELDRHGLPATFHSETIRRVLTAMVALHRAGEVPSLPLLTARLPWMRRQAPKLTVQAAAGRLIRDPVAELPRLLADLKDDRGRAYRREVRAALDAAITRDDQAEVARLLRAYQDGPPADWTPGTAPQPVRGV